MFDRDAARGVLSRFSCAQGDRANPILDALTGCVRPVPPQNIDRAALLRVFEEQGFSTGGDSPHGWRCEHPDRFPGYCTCVADMADAVLARVMPDSRFDTIRALHRFATYSDDGPASEGTWCHECRDPWPCATVRALDGET